MALNLKKIFNAVTDIVPLGSTVKSLIRGATGLLVKKAAKAVGIPEAKTEAMLVEAARMSENDHEIKLLLINEEKEKRAHELAVFGRFAELDAGSKKWVARIRPILSLGLVGTYVAFCWIHLYAQLFPYKFGFETPPVFPPSLIKVTLWVCGFWFVGRTVEKVTDIFQNGKSLSLDVNTITNWK